MDEWFSYNGFGSVFDPINYVSTPIPICPDPKERLCAIKARRQLINGIPRPIITPSLQAQITAALSTLTESANVLLRPN